MDTPPIVWELDKTTGAYVAVFADHPKRLASVRLRVDGSYWNLHLLLERRPDRRKRAHRFDATNLLSEWAIAWPSWKAAWNNPMHREVFED
jgi:hypothetical protein